MMIAKEYIDRIDKLNLFYLSFYDKSYCQWSELETDIDGDLSKWDYPIVFNQVFTIIGSCRIRSVYNEHCIFMYNNIQLDHVEYCINVNGDTNPVGQLSAYEHCKVYMLGI